jgi:hypothetical protein
MADKNFGVKGINFVGDPGTPTISIASSTITYAGNLNLNAPTVAISTDVSIGGKVVSNLVISDTYSVGIGTTVLTEKLNVSGNANISGVVSATGFVGSGVSLTGLLTNQSSAINTGEYQYLLVTPQTSGTISSVSSSHNYIIFNPAAKYLGIGTNIPTAGLDVNGTGRFIGTVTAPTFQGTATTATNLADAANITTGTIDPARLSGTYNISISGNVATATTASGLTTTASVNTTGIITATGGFVGNLTGTATTANNVSSTININTSGIITASSFTGNLAGTATTATTALGFSTTASINTSGIITASSFTGNLTGTATTANNVSSTININTSGIITASTFYGNLVGNISTTGQSFNTISVIGLSTFANGPILVGRATTTGTATQALQVESGGYFNGSVGIGTTNPSSKLHVVGDGNFTGTVTATSFSGSGSNLTDLLSNTVSTSSTTAPQYIGFVSATSGTITSNLVSSTLTYIPSSGSLGIGTTNPRTPLQVETYGVKTGVGTFDASVGVSTTIDSFSVSSTDFKVAEYTVHIGFGSYIQAQKVLVTQDQSTAYSSEYAVVYNNSLIVSIGATISGGNCILQATPQTDISGLTTYRFARNTLL